MACLLRFGPPPRARDPERPTEAEQRALGDMLDQYRAVFAEH
jgi:hypothetical protein